MPFLEIKIVKQRLDHVLAVVEGATYGNIVDIVIGHRRHLQGLNRRGLTVGMHDEDGNPFFATHAMNSSTAGIPGGGADNIQPFTPLRQDIFEEISQKL